VSRVGKVRGKRMQGARGARSIVDTNGQKARCNAQTTPFLATLSGEPGQISHHAGRVASVVACIPKCGRLALAWKGENMARVRGQAQNKQTGSLRLSSHEF